MQNRKLIEELCKEHAEKLEKIDEKIENIRVEIAEIKTELKNHLKHHAWDYKRSVLLVSIIAIVITTAVSLLTKLLS